MAEAGARKKVRIHIHRHLEGGVPKLLLDVLRGTEGNREWAAKLDGPVKQSLLSAKSATRRNLKDPWSEMDAPTNGFIWWR